MSEHFQKLSSAIEPIQSSVGVHTHTQLSLLKKSSLLPSPLYSIFHQLADYKFTRDENAISIEIEGDESQNPNLNNDVNEFGDIERSAKRQQLDTPKQNSSVWLKIILSEDIRRSAEDKSISMQFTFHPIPVGSEIEGIVGGGIVGVKADSESHQNLLHNLFGPDPLIPTLPINLRKLNPYTWAQIMGGLIHFPQKNILVKPGNRKFGINIPDLLKRLKLRVETGPMLKKQIDFLSKLTIPIPVPSPVFPLPAETKLEQFVELSEIPKQFRNENGDENDYEFSGNRYFKAVFVCGSKTESFVELECLIELSSEYPLRAPTFHLQFTQHPNPEPNHHINHLNAMMREVNAYFTYFTPEKEEDMTLSFQMRHLQMMLDIYVRTEIKGESDVGSQLSIRRNFGRDRQKPWAYNKKLKMFEQRKT
eukprot:c15545_g1_i2.p1 GENE.c15545_g1_i2~~c15545_g1_i2.p1  ORF type:complete len:421 (+),score=174.47 c15545_g1_i2:39-1301(+)